MWVAVDMGLGLSLGLPLGLGACAGAFVDVDPHKRACMHTRARVCTRVHVRA